MGGGEICQNISRFPYVVLFFCIILQYFQVFLTMKRWESGSKGGMREGWMGGENFQEISRFRYVLLFLNYFAIFSSF